MLTLCKLYSSISISFQWKSVLWSYFPSFAFVALTNGYPEVHWL